MSLLAQRWVGLSILGANPLRALCGLVTFHLLMDRLGFDVYSTLTKSVLDVSDVGGRGIVELVIGLC